MGLDIQYKKKKWREQKTVFQIMLEMPQSSLGCLNMETKCVADLTGNTVLDVKGLKLLQGMVEHRRKDGILPLKR